jgi:hypothetical protein
MFQIGCSAPLCAPELFSGGVFGSEAASEDLRNVGLYGLMVMVNVALTQLSSESDTCMVKV